MPRLGEAVHGAWYAHTATPFRVVCGNPPHRDCLDGLPHTAIRAEEVDERNRPYELHFRETLDFRRDAAYLNSLARRPDVSADRWALLLTVEESRELDRRSAIPDKAAGLVDWGDRNPGVFGGLHIDHQAGGTLVVSLTAEATREERAEVVSAGPGDVPLLLREVAHPLLLLKTVQADIQRRLADNELALAAVHSMGYSIPDNVIEIVAEPAQAAGVALLIKAEYGDSLFSVLEGGPDTLTCPKRPHAGRIRFAAQLP